MASVLFEYECNIDDGLVRTADTRSRVGYITSLTLDKEKLGRDLTVSIPFIAGANPSYRSLKFDGVNGSGKAPVVGVIEKFSWEGGVGHPIEFIFWVSQENATILTKQQNRPDPKHLINKLSWWIMGYDGQTNRHFEQAYAPKGGVTGSHYSRGDWCDTLEIAPLPETIVPGIDVFMYKASFKIYPGANRHYILEFSKSPTTKYVKNWGLIIGNLAS